MIRAPLITKRRVHGTIAHLQTCRSSFCRNWLTRIVQSAFKQASR